MRLKGGMRGCVAFCCGGELGSSSQCLEKRNNTLDSFLSAMKG